MLNEYKESRRQSTNLGDLSRPDTSKVSIVGRSFLLKQPEETSI